MENNINRFFKFSEIFPTTTHFSGKSKVTNYLGTSDNSKIFYFSSDFTEKDTDSLVQKFQSDFVKSKSVTIDGGNTVIKFGTLHGHKTVMVFSESVDIYLVK